MQGGMRVNRNVFGQFSASVSQDAALSFANNAPIKHSPHRLLRKIHRPYGNSNLLVVFFLYYYTSEYLYNMGYRFIIYKSRNL